MALRKILFNAFFAIMILSPNTVFSENRILKKISDLEEKVDELTGEVNELKKEIGEIKGELRQINKRFEDINRRFEDINRRFDDINSRFEDINKRFEDMNRRFDDINRRFDELSKRIDDLKDIMIAMFAGLVALVISVIGFAFWDRRTILRRAVEESRAQIEGEGKLKDVIQVLRELAKVDKKVEEAMRKVGLL